jgi:hypothetical protein
LPQAGIGEIDRGQSDRARGLFDACADPWHGVRF